MVNGGSAPGHPLELSRFASSLTATNAVATRSSHTLRPSSEQPSPVASSSHGGIDKISRLPNEILAALLGLALPRVDATICFPAPGVCRSYVIGLYALRQISAPWRDFIDGTPNLWFIVSSTTPIDIIAVCLSRSKACPLLIHYENGGDYGDSGDSEDSEAREAMKERTSFLQFSRLTIPHRHRWAILWLNAAPYLVFDQLKGTMPVLHTVKLDSTGKTRAPWYNPANSSETSLEIDIKTLRHVELRGGPASWGWRRFSGLRIWKLKELVGDGLTTHHIIEVLRESPLLEVLVIERLRVQIIPKDTVLAPISLTRLRRIIFRWCQGHFVNHILRHIQASVELIEEALIAVRDWGFLQPLGLFTDGLASWIPLLRRAHRTCSGSRFSISTSRTWSWIAKGPEKRLYLSFAGSDTVNGIRWMIDALSQGNEPGPGVGIECRYNILQNAELLGTLGSIKKISRFEAQADWTKVSVKILFQVLSNPINPGFPWLENLRLSDWIWSTESIVQMLQARFPDNGTDPTQLPTLTIEFFHTTAWWWLEDPPVQRQIIDLRAVKRISGLNGVGGIRFGSAGGEVGMLGVVWSDELLGPTWG